MSASAIRLRNLSTSFVEASTRWPNLESHLVTWPEDQPAPADLMELTQFAIPYPKRGEDGNMWFKDSLVGGCETDNGDARFRPKRAGALILRRSFGMCFGDPRIVKDPDEYTACGDRLRALASDGVSILLDRIGQLRLSSHTRAWLVHQVPGWQLAVHEIAPGEQLRTDNDVLYEKIADLFLASANAAEMLSQHFEESPRLPLAAVDCEQEGRALNPAPDFTTVTSDDNGFAWTSDASCANAVDDGCAEEQRPCYVRDHLWLGWYDAEGSPTFHSPAKIRDKWNALPKEQRQGQALLPKGRPGRDRVKTAVRSAREERDRGK